MKLKAKHIKTVTGTPADLMYYVDREGENGTGRIVFGNGHMMIITGVLNFPSNFALHKRGVNTARAETEQDPGDPPNWKDICSRCKAGDRLLAGTLEDKPNVEIIYDVTDGDQLRPLTDGNGTIVCINEKYYQVIKTLELNIHLDKNEKDPTRHALTLTGPEDDFAGLIMPMRT